MIDETAVQASFLANQEIHFHIQKSLHFTRPGVKWVL